MVSLTTDLGRLFLPLTELVVAPFMARYEHLSGGDRVRTNPQIGKPVHRLRHKSRGRVFSYPHGETAKMWNIILKIQFRLALAMGIILPRWLKHRGW